VGTPETTAADDGTSEATGVSPMSAPPLQLPISQMRDETNAHALASPNVWQRTRKSCQKKEDWAGLANENTAMTLVRNFICFLVFVGSYRFCFFGQCERVVSYSCHNCNPQYTIR
jgi:hypothetical protein